MQKCKGNRYEDNYSTAKQYTNCKDAANIEEISKGFSPDKKYVITNANNEKYLFRTGDIKSMKERK